MFLLGALACIVKAVLHYQDAEKGRVDYEYLTPERLSVIDGDIRNISAQVGVNLVSAPLNLDNSQVTPSGSPFSGNAPAEGAPENPYGGPKPNNS